MAQRMASVGGKRPTYRDLDADGTAQSILDQLIDSTLIGIQEQRRNFSVDKAYVDRQMRKGPQFQNEDGGFDAELWNAWVRERADMDWKAYRNDLKNSVSRQVYLNMALAPAGRILDSEIDKELEADATKLEVKFAKIEPEVVPTEEELQKQEQNLM